MGKYFITVTLIKNTITFVINMKLPFKIKEIKPSIFLFEFTNQYDMCMHFLRYQEFYESPNPKFRRKSFTILEFMKWQAETEGYGNFTYPSKWSGFNIPSNVFYNCIDKTNSSHDYNTYDENMAKAYIKCIGKNSSTYNDYKLIPLESLNKFYIIGAMQGNIKTLNHEICHGLFYLNSEYRKEARKLVETLPVKIINSMEKYLTKSGYTESVFIDEINAYFSTDTKQTLINRGIKITNQDLPFKKLFKKYNK